MDNLKAGADDENVGMVGGEINDDHWTGHSRHSEVTKRDGTHEILEFW
jgi:hypothetical protein